MPPQPHHPTWLRALGLGLLLAVAGAALLGWDSLRSDDQLRETVGRNLQADLATLLAQVQAEPPTAQPSAEPRPPEAPVVVVVNRNTGRLLHWTDNRLVPDPTTVLGLLRSANPQLVNTPAVVYYVLKRPLAEGREMQLTLVPLVIRYPISNRYLENYLFSGRYAKGYFGQTLEGARVLNTKTENSIALTDPQGCYLYSLDLANTAPLRKPWRIGGLLLLLLGLVGLCWGLGRWARWRFRSALAGDVLFLGLLFGLRLLLLALRLPGAWVETQLFSSSVLAFDELDPSLGDFTLNVWLFFITVWRLHRHVSPQRVWQRMTALPAWQLQLAVAGVAAGSTLLTVVYFQLVDALVMNSKVYTDFLDLTRVDAYSYLAYLNLALTLVSFFLLQFMAARLLTRWLRERGQWLTISTAALLGTLATAAALQLDWRHTGLVLCYLPLLGFVAWHQPEGYRFQLTFAFLLFAAFAVLTHAQLNVSLDQLQRQNLQRLASRYGTQRDILSETLFESLVQSITQDDELWQQAPQPGKSPDLANITNQLIYNHLADNFRNYDFRIFYFNALGQLMGGTSDTRPQQPYLGQSGVDTTIVGRFFYVNNPAKPTQLFYVGRMRINSRLLGRLLLQVELHPKVSLTGRLLPNLFLPQDLRDRLQLPPNVELGIYDASGRLLKQEGNQTFPLRMASFTPESLSQLGHLTDRLVLHSRQGELNLLVGAPRRNLGTQLTAFSFLFYIFFILFLFYLGGIWLQQVWQRRVWDLQPSFTLRLQLFLTLLGIVPLAAIGLLTTPLLDTFFRDEAERQLRQNLDRVSAQLQASSTLLEDLKAGNDRMRPENRQRLNRIGALLEADLNLYDLSGRLHASTIPEVYQRLVNFNYMNPVVLLRFRVGMASQLVARERISELVYLAGYQVVLNEALEPVGFLNLPSLARQDLLDAQKQRFIAFFLNAFIIILLVLIVGGLFVSKQLTAPLKLVSEKLRDTQLGGKNEPIEWKTGDEIGQLVGAYNQMVDKLQKSEARLARTQRDAAWREMARQVAHEIKNPLTPMRLSLQHLQRLLRQPERMKPEDAERLTQTLLTQIDSLTNIANSFSQFTSIDTGKAAPFCLNDLLAEVATLYRDAPGTELNLDLQLTLPPERLWITADRNQVNQALLNLVRNALQALQTGNANPARITLTLERVEQEQCRIAVADNGPGIAEHIRHRIFEPNFSTKNSGMGLGLAITRRIVEAYGGNIWFESITPQPASEPPTPTGTTFYIQFPLQAAPAASAADSPPIQSV